MRTLHGMQGVDDVKMQFKEAVSRVFCFINLHCVESDSAGLGIRSSVFQVNHSFFVSERAIHS